MLCLVCPLLLQSCALTKALTQNGHYRPSHLNSTFKGTQFLPRHFQKQNTSISTSDTGVLLQLQGFLVMLKDSCCASSSRRGKGTFSHLSWPSTPELGSNCPKSSEIHPSVENYCPCGRAHTSVCLHSVAPVHSSAPQWVPKHIPFAQNYRGHNCCQRHCLGEQGGLDLGHCHISLLQGSRAY